MLIVSEEVPTLIVAKKRVITAFSYPYTSTFKDVTLITKFDDIEEFSCVIRQDDSGCDFPLWAPVEDSHLSLYFIYDNPSDHQTIQQ